MCSATNRRTTGAVQLHADGGDGSKLNNIRTIHSLARRIRPLLRVVARLVSSASTARWNASSGRRLCCAAAPRTLSLMPRGATKSDCVGVRGTTAAAAAWSANVDSLSTSATIVSVNADTRWSSAVFMAWSRLPSALCTVPREAPSGFGDGGEAELAQARGAAASQSGSQHPGGHRSSSTRRRAFEQISNMFNVVNDRYLRHRQLGSESCPKTTVRTLRRSQPGVSGVR